jgi:hypothetical protein
VVSFIQKVNSQHLLITYNQLTGTVVWSWSYGSWIYNYLWNPITTKVVSSNPVHGEVHSTLVGMSQATIRISIDTCIGLVSVKCLYARFVVFNATINNISVISWRSVLLVEETGISGENHNTDIHDGLNTLSFTSVIVSSERGQDKKQMFLECRWYNLRLDRTIYKAKAGIKVLCYLRFFRNP